MRVWRVASGRVAAVNGFLHTVEPPRRAATYSKWTQLFLKSVGVAQDYGV
jgi:hypothetical protein